MESSPFRCSYIGGCQARQSSPQECALVSVRPGRMREADRWPLAAGPSIRRGMGSVGARGWADRRVPRCTVWPTSPAATPSLRPALLEPVQETPDAIPVVCPEVRLVLRPVAEVGGLAKQRL